MKSVPISEFKLMKVPQIKEGGSFNIVADGEFLAIVVVPASAEKRAQFQGLCDQMNIALRIK